MQSLRVVIAKLRALFRRNGISREIRDEMEFHIDMRADEFARDGRAEDEARRAAARRFGNLAVMRDRGYDVRGGGFLETVIQDVRFGVRLLIKQPGFSLVAILTLALGIGVSTALFSMIDAALIRPLPYADPDQLVDVRVVGHRNGQPRPLTPSIGDIRRWRESGRVFSHIGIADIHSARVVVDAGQPERLTVGSATEDSFETYGIRPLLGRSIHFDDTRAGAPRVAVIGHEYWQSRFGGVQDVIGRSIRIANVPATVVGVLPPGFYAAIPVWIPFEIAERAILTVRGVGPPPVGRLLPGLTADDASRLLSEITPAVESAGESGHARVELTALYDLETGVNSRQTVRVLTVAVLLVVALACVNVAGLLLARGRARRSELAIRASIGAGRSRLVRQLLVESVVLALASGVVGTALAWLCLDALAAVTPLIFPDNSIPHINPSVLLFALTMSVVTAVASGLVPAFRLSRVNLVDPVRAARGNSGSSPVRRSAQILSAVEVALAVVLLAGAGLTIRSFARVLAVDLGFDPRHVVMMEVEPVDQAREVRKQFYPALVSALRALPEVEAVGAIDALTLMSATAVVSARTETGVPITFAMREVLPGYFEALGVRPAAGRFPTDADRLSGEPVAVISQETATRFFSGQSPIGQILENDNEPSVRRRIVGVVPTLRHTGPRARLRPQMYYVDGSQGGDALAVVLRFWAGKSIPSNRLRQIAQTVGPRVAVGEIKPGTDLLRAQVEFSRNQTALLSLLGGLGLLLTLVGILSTTAYAVTQRTREIGVRMALGARPSSVVWQVARGGAWPAVIGISAGLVVAFYATTAISSFLFQTPPRDPVTFACVALVMAVTALLAAWIPARRAARVDPVIALRAE